MEICELCSLSEEDKKYFLCKNDFWDVYLADNQNYIGRCIIVCKRHCKSIEDLSNEEWLSFKELVVRIEKAISNALSANMFNLSCLMNDEYKKKNPNPHLHFHLIPRYSKQVKIGDTLFEDKEWAHHYHNKAPVQLSPNDIDIVFNKISAEIL